ncbi:TonB-dependent receptor [Bradyrhizobium sp. U87765 SZCCT0131]|uniref:TonB-dependent receptor plug domain-containing protein n=1 Tax=unclassified Bradyrhizobium TaxID=2631580 RepID=UPI001BA932F2|nr:MULTISPECIES: TonB-dependent receptor [unclassified Bradyrhizobium]MBR1217475.1 TonB-dependent receptor [Bradyrhizobium sp. U87765 SZCCT0131]MBR1264928.1 TonB-dependent receptor [Bradyrhizobium sp. U87765 SZCCT0134]MBR1304910.1 TonB-dependent receptor [Bradyrhizobium sp. U87765 SZCCT0110]MBR1320696.1 TonB-dependent receptor [Bradyrhizobium sp. U87765 SZCCT0109]MBR1349116.1 TonB-dependent receptor [Bradyrhizobium sp. U87765 SZCCT0048]
MTHLLRAGATAACIALSLDAAHAEQSPQQLPEMVVTADRTPEAIGRTGSAISVVNGATLQATNPGTLVDALRSVPGLDITESGGPGATANIRLRGANTGQTLVMIDGIRVNDPTAASGDFDFSILGPSAIERIEVLRGPQSALYGSDAIGGVVNIITKSGQGPAQVSARTEAGSYGTINSSAAITGSQGPWSYAVTGGAGRSEGFSRYGYRIPAIEAKFPNLENDGYDRLGGSARVGYDAGEGFRVETGILSSYTRSDYDAATGKFPDTPSTATRLLNQVWGKATVDTFDGLWTHSVNVFATRINRSFNDVSYGATMLPANTTSTRTDYIGNSVGAEYQSTLKLGWAGSLIYGARTQHETADTYLTKLLPVSVGRTPQLSATQDTNSLFALWQLPVGERLTLTLGGRMDDVASVATFETWRATAAYAITETGTKLRASAGTGAKAPTLYQLNAPIYGNSSLSPEQSIGYDAGIDQALFNGRVNLSATVFENRFSNLIDFAYDAANPLGHYINVSRAETAGVELGADVTLLPGFARLTAAYTYLHAKDLATGLTLQRRPSDVMRLALALTPTEQWMIEPRILYVSRRFSGNGETSPLAAYTRVDLYSEYKIDQTWKVYARGENIFNARYQEVANYGTTGPAIYGGVSATW